MKASGLIILTFLALYASRTTAYNAYPRSSYAPSYTASSHATASITLDSNCCETDQWTFDHHDEVWLFENRLRQEYRTMSHGSTTSIPSSNKIPWSANILQLTGKTPSELDALARRVSEQIIMDMRKGIIKSETFRKPTFFQWKSSEALRSCVTSDEDFGQHQQQEENLNFGHLPSPDLSKYDEVKNYNYPTEVKMIDGRPYVVHTNYTEASKNLGDGYQMRQRNLTTIASSNTPSHVPTNSYGGNSMVTYQKKKTIQDWYTENVEPDVVDYKPIWETYKHEQPRGMSVNEGFNRDVENIGSGPNLYRPTIYNNPSSTTTLHRYNKTVIRNSNGINQEYGSELNRKWVDGKLVYDSERPFGDFTVPRDEDWKREERERFFWFLTQDQISNEKLEAWQRQQEERLLGLAERWRIGLDEIYDWQRQELERYQSLLRQYQTQTTDYTSWKRAERGRLDWLIHQNSVTREDLERWQQENSDKLNQLASQYRISVTNLKNWQVEELNRLYRYFNDQNNSMVTRPTFNSEALRQSEQARLDELIRQHNSTIAQLHNSIRSDQQKLAELSQKYRGNVQDMEKWLQTELNRLKDVLNEQHNEMERITSWQRTERGRLENILKLHRGSLDDLEKQMARDRSYMQSLATKYKVSIGELENWQRAELQRLQNEGKQQFDNELKDWQLREREHLKSILQKNDLTIEEFKSQIINDRARLQQLANTYKVQVSEVEEWIEKEIKNFQSEGLLKEVRQELELWQKQERQRLENIVKENSLSVEELEAKIKQDQTHLFAVAQTYQVGVEDVENWLKQELQRLQSSGLVKVEDLQEWQKQEREDLLKIVQQNKLTVEEFENKLLSDRVRLANLANDYNIKTTEIESWIRKEGERLQNLGLLQMREELNNWQKIERERILNLVTKNNLSIEELEGKINKDQVHLYSLAQQHQVRVEEIEAWIKQEIKKLQEEGLIEMGKLKDWQTEWRGNLTNMVRQRDFTVEEFHKWLLEDRARLQALATQHNVQIEEIEQWINNEEQRFVSMGLLKPNEKLTNWQEVERRYLERITQDQYHSTEQLEHRLRQDRELLQQLASDYSVQVEEIENWMKKELARLRDEGQLQIDNLTAWQIAERGRLEDLAKQNKQWSLEEFEAELNKDKDHMQRTAFQYHTSVEEVENWLKSEVDRLKNQGKINIDSMTAWQKAEHKRILNLLQQQSGVTADDFEQRIQKDRKFIVNLASQYHVGVNEIEEYVKKVVEDLKVKGRFELEKLQTWQSVEREYIKQLINEHKNDLSTAQYVKKLRNDRAHLNQLAQQFHLNVAEIEKWMVDEVHRLRSSSEAEVRKLAVWQQSEALRLKELIKQNSHLSYVTFEMELLNERQRLQELAKQYSLSVEQIEDWLRQQLVNLKTTGEIEVENLSQWQSNEQKRLIDTILQDQKMLTETEFETQLNRDHLRLESLSQTYNVDVEKIETWMRDELQRLKDSGLLQVEQLTQWQTQERERLQNWLQQQHQVASYEDFNEFLRRDKERMANIARDYQLTVEEVESWVQQEGARLQVLGHIKRPQSSLTVNEYGYNWQSNTDNQYVNNAELLWKNITLEHLKYFINVGQIQNLADVDSYLMNEKRRLQNFAQQYQVTVEEIVTWLREEANSFVAQGVIQGSNIQEAWEFEERELIQNLINERELKQQQWSIEELERQLLNDQRHLQQLSIRYHKTVEEFEAWYKSELQKLLEQRKIVSENLVDWQIREKNRLYKIVTYTPNLTVESMKIMVLNDNNRLNHLADTYHVNIQELKYWISNEINRLHDLGLLHEESSAKNWQQMEDKRLHDITSEIMITEQEFLEYIAIDTEFQRNLAHSYGIRQDELAPFQRIKIGNMQSEGIIENIQLIQLENWQKTERDNLYKLITTTKFELKDLQKMQGQVSLMQELAAKYNIEVEVLKAWQLKEYERLLQIADYYRMTLQQLAYFREQEINYINYIMHKIITTESERLQWKTQEAQRTVSLESLSGLRGVELLEWRRKLYLLSQGLIPFYIRGNGGHETGVGTTNRTGVPYHESSKDRGDQPSVVHEEDFDGDEPGLLGENLPYKTPSSPIIDIMPTTDRLIVYPGPTARVNTRGGYRYTKKESSYNLPIADSQASASVGRGGAMASASASATTRDPYATFNGMVSESLTAEGDLGQQQQQEEIDNFGQQQQVDLDWNGHYTGSQDINGQQQQQQQQQQETLRGKSTDQYDQNLKQQQQNVEDFGQQQQQQEEVDFGQQQVQVDNFDSSKITSPSAQQKTTDSATDKQIEVQTEPESPGIFTRLKNKIFG